MILDWLRGVIRRVSLRQRRIVFVLYALLTATATHWPKLQIPLPQARPDIVAHMGIFGLWAALLLLCGFFGRPLSGRNILIGGVVAVAYSAIDEATQALPGVNRVAALDDALANAAGVTVAVLLFWAASRQAQASESRRPQPMSSE